MTGNSESAARALEILKSWQWGRYDPDGCLLSNSFQLADVINRLAFQEQDRPADAILTLLCEGKLVAICNYRWLKFQHARRYEVSEHMEFLDKSKWLTLAQMLEEELRLLDTNEWGNPTTTLEKLELNDCTTVEWEPSFNRCSYAACPPETSAFDPQYYEEWFSAWEIEVALASSEMDDAPDAFFVSDADDGQPDALQSANPPIAQAELSKWWDSKADVRDLLTKDELLALVRAKYPDKHVSRDRVRDLVGARKRGPKPFRD